MRLGVPHLWLTYKHYIFNEVWKIDHAVKYIVHYGARIQCVCCFVSFLCQSIGEVLPPPLHATDNSTFTFYFKYF
jgi:hypothetical protein